MLNRYFIHLGFLGTHYHGWQVQPNSITVQEVLDKVLSVFFRETIRTTGCGRTDTGVHAPFFFAHFDSVATHLHEDAKIIHQLNCMLPVDIVIYRIYPVAGSDHARFDAISRTYLYRITHTKNPFTSEFSTYYSRPLRLDLMNQACEYLKGFTDFTSFSKLHTDVKTNNCRIFSADWAEIQGEIQFTITADRFLRNMVRAIVGSLLEVGWEKISLTDFCQIIIKKDRSSAGMSVPAKGLYLINLQYPERFIFRNDQHFFRLIS